MAQIKEPKHAAGSNNVKYNTNPNNKHWVYILQLYT